jgi:hypothetical protein
VVTRALAVGRPKVVAGVIITRLTLPGPGRVGQRATTKVGEATLRVCAARTRRKRAGRMTMRCRLSSSARRLLRSRVLRLTLRTRFVPDGGQAIVRTRRLTAGGGQRD